MTVNKSFQLTTFRLNINDEFSFFHFTDVMTASEIKDLEDYRKSLTGKESAPSSGTAEDQVKT